MCGGFFSVLQNKNDSAKNAQSAAEGIFISSRTEVFPQKSAKG